MARWKRQSREEGRGRFTCGFPAAVAAGAVLLLLAPAFARAADPDIEVRQLRAPNKARDCGSPKTVTVVVKNLGTARRSVMVSLYRSLPGGAEIYHDSWSDYIDPGRRLAMKTAFNPAGTPPPGTVTWRAVAVMHDSGPPDQYMDNNEMFDITQVVSCK